jgi:phage FluMu protein gp41
MVRFLNMSDLHHPLSIQQIRQVNQDVAELTDRAQEITKILLAAYGAEDPRAVRAQEVSDAVQRLQWAMEREPNTAST